MSVADTSFPFAVPPATDAAPLPAPPAPSVVQAGGAGAGAPVAPRPPAPPPPVHVAPWNLPRPPRPRPDGLDRDTGRLIAISFGIAFVVAPLLEPMSSGPLPDYPLWQLPIDLAALAAVVAAVAVLWRGGRNGARLGAATGVLMAVLTIICPLAGHSPVGWWTWAQVGLSLYVMGTSAMLMARSSRQAPPPPR